MFKVVDVIAASQAVFESYGFVSKAASFHNGARKSNSAILYEHLFKTDDKDTNFSIELTEEHYKKSREIIDYLKGLTFKAFERDLTEFENSVLKFVTTDHVGPKSLGIAACLPEVYENKLKQEDWEIRERELSSTSDYVGLLNKRYGDPKTKEYLQLLVEHVRHIGSAGSWLYCCSHDDKNIVKFFSHTKIGNEGDTLCLCAYVKSQTESKFHGGKETFLNRIKVEQVIEKSSDED